MFGYAGTDNYKLKALQNPEEKRWIARKAVDFVDHSDIVILDSGTTCNEVAHALVEYISFGQCCALTSNEHKRNGQHSYKKI
jgi:DeoR/GlpR family transcriptional regulator of sugar metabolism